MYKNIFQMDRYSSNLSETNIMCYLKCFKNLRLFMTNKTHLLLEAAITFRGRWASTKLLMEFTSHLGKKVLLSGLIDELDMHDPQRNDCCTWQKKVRWLFAVMRELSDILQDTEESKWWTLPVQGRYKRSSNFLLHGNVCQIL